MPHAFSIPLQLDSYESIFNEFDYRELDNRKLNADIDQLIKDILFEQKLKEIEQVQLMLYLPRSVEDFQKEKLVTKGLLDYYQSFSEYKKKIHLIGFFRIGYYLITAFFLFILYYLISSTSGETFISAILSTAGTVIIWQATSLVFIDSKNFRANMKLNKLLSYLKIQYIYTD